jgi:hypothetical protein
MSTVNKLKNAWINTDTSLSGTYQTCSLLNNGASEFAGNVVIDNKLAINRAVDGANDYKLDISGNSRISDLVISNKNKLSQVQYITTSTSTLTFNSAEYVVITSSCPNNSTIYLPLVTSSSQIGTKFTFFYNFEGTTPTVSIYTASGSLQTIVDNLYATAYNYLLISYSRSYIELVCCNYTTNGISWALSNGGNDFSLFPQLIGVNNWSSNNYFNTILPTSTITTFNNNNQFVTKYYTDNKFAPLASPTLTGNPITTTQLTTDNSTRIASTAYVKSNLSSYQLTSGMSSYLTSATASTTYQTITGMSSYLTSATASTTYQPLSTMSNYVLQSDLTGSYVTGSYIANNYASLSGTNAFLGGGSFGGALSLKGNTSIIDSKTFTITSGSTFNCNSGSTANFNGTTNFSSVPTINSVNIATLNDLPNTSVIYAPSFRSNTQSAGGIICGFQSNNGDSRFVMYDEGLGLTPNCAVIQTLAGNGIGLQAVYGTINNFIGTTLRTQVTSSGFDVTGNLSFTGNINTISSTIFGYISGLSSSAQTQLDSKASKTLNNTFSGSQFYNASCSFTSSTTFTILPSASSAITTANTDDFITKRIANLLYCGVQSPTIFTPTIKISAPFIPSGEIISTFSNDAGDTILVRNTGYGLTPNAMCIDTAQANGLSLNANTGSSSINFHIAKTLIGQILSTGLSITGNISFTGSLGSITQTIFSNIATAFGKQTPSSSGSVITAATSLSPPFSEVYSVFNGATAFTITIPQASVSNAGVILTFRRASGSTSTTAISLTTSGSTQLIYNGVNSGATTFSMLASGVYIIQFVSITNGTTYGWHQL